MDLRQRNVVVEAINSQSVNGLEIADTLQKAGENMAPLSELESQRIVRAMLKGYMKLLTQQIKK
ncbi:hypothetical protein [Lysinibacillus xylanilyticus]|uniref:hypothetical protein n=1 Tax=Lysinibacillus xylanilyticus TaxID=582475 RepID=UPI003D04755B